MQATLATKAADLHCRIMGRRCAMRAAVRFACECLFGAGVVLGLARPIQAAFIFNPSEDMGKYSDEIHLNPETPHQVFPGNPNVDSGYTVVQAKKHWHVHSE